MTLSATQIDAIRKALPGAFDGEILSTPLEALPSSTFDDVYNTAMDALTNDGADVLTLYAFGSFGPFAVRVVGVPGAYFVRADEYDDEGVFTTVDEADPRGHIGWAGVDMYEDEESAELAWEQTQ